MELRSRCDTDNPQRTCALYRGLTHALRAHSKREESGDGGTPLPNRDHCYSPRCVARCPSSALPTNDKAVARASRRVSVGVCGWLFFRACGNGVHTCAIYRHSGDPCGLAVSTRRPRTHDHQALRVTGCSTSSPFACCSSFRGCFRVSRNSRFRASLFRSPGCRGCTYTLIPVCISRNSRFRASCSGTPDTG